MTAPRLQARTLDRVRDVQILRSQNFSNPEIARRLGITVRSVERHATRSIPNGPAVPSNTTSWDKKASCRRHDPELFFPDVYYSGDPRVRYAKAICRLCPAFDECLAFVEAHPDLASDGVWAATTPAERRRARQLAFRGAKTSSSANAQTETAA